MRKIFLALLLIALVSSTVYAVERGEVSAQRTQVVLHIGDSHTAGIYGKELDELLIANYEVHTYGCVGASPLWFLNNGGQLCNRSSMEDGDTIDYFSENIDQLIKDFQPDVVIISLGTNGLTAEGVRDLSSAVISARKKCYWVSPPSYQAMSQTTAAYDEQYDILKSNVGQCTLIDSRSFNSGQNVHFTSETSSIAKAWAQAVFNQVTESVAAAPVSQAPAALSVTAQLTPKVMPQKQKEIDEVWLLVGQVIHGVGENKVWDSSLGALGWRTFNEVYFIATGAVSSAPPVITRPSTSGNEYNTLIEQVGREYGMEASLIKALIFYESSFNSNAISTAGCSGLMQICYRSAPSEVIITKCSQEREKGPTLCTSGTDDRFNPEKNIRGGTLILKGMSDAIGNCGKDKYKAVIAAYNFGSLSIKKAIQSNNNNCDNWNTIWDILNSNFNSQENTIFGVKKSYYTSERLNALRGTNSDYVGQVYNKYLSYKQYGLSGSGTVIS